MKRRCSRSALATMLVAFLLMSCVPCQKTTAEIVPDAAKRTGIVYAFWPNSIDPLTDASLNDYQPDWSALDYVSFFGLDLQSNGTLALGNHEALFESVYRAAKKIGRASCRERV